MALHQGVDSFIASGWLTHRELPDVWPDDVTITRYRVPTQLDATWLDLTEPPHSISREYHELVEKHIKRSLHLRFAGIDWSRYKVKPYKPKRGWVLGRKRKPVAIDYEI